MIRHISTAIAAAALLALATGAGAFTLLSPPIRVTNGGFFECGIYNYSASKTMAVNISIFDTNGAKVVSSDVICNGLNNSHCFRLPSDASESARAVVCRFDVTQVAKSDVRASVLSFDAALNLATALEAR